MPSRCPELSAFAGDCEALCGDYAGQKFRDIPSDPLREQAKYYLGLSRLAQRVLSDRALHCEVDSETVWPPAFRTLDAADAAD